MKGKCCGKSGLAHTDIYFVVEAKQIVKLEAE